MNPEWLCYVNGQEYGPYTWPQLVQMAAAGNVVPATHVRRNFDSQWYLAEQVPGLFAPIAPSNPKQAAHPATPPRTKPVAAKPATKSVPTGIPAAAATASLPQPMPAAAALLPEPAIQAPVVQPAAVPKGRVVSPAPVPAAATTTAERKPRWIPVEGPATTTTSPAASLAVASQPADNAKPMPSKKADSSKQMILYLGAAIAGVAVMGTGALIWKFTRPSVEEKEVVVAPVVVPETEIDPNVVSEEANPAAEANPVATSATKTPATKGQTTPAVKTAANDPKKTAAIPVTPPASLAVLKSVKEWKQIEKFASFAVRPGLKCTKLNAYLAADAAGRKIPVRYTPPSEAAGDATAARYVSAEPAAFLFVEIGITNPEATPRTYAGWNNGETSALLVDAASKPFTLLPASATPGVKRLGSKEVQPGEAIQDTLVFAVPPTAEMLYRLALPKPAFTPKLSGAWAYEITGASLAELSASAQSIAGDPAVAAPGQPAPAPRSSTSIPIPGLQDVPPPQPAPQPAPAAPAPPEPEKKPMSSGPIPIPGLTDVPDNKPAGPKKPEEVPNLTPPDKK